jgi:hypothetical protein
MAVPKARIGVENSGAQRPLPTQCFQDVLNSEEGVGEVEIMPNVLIHKASELKAQTRVVLEAELGRSLQDDEEVSIMAFSPRAAPTGEARREAARKLQEHFNRIDQKLKEAPEEEVEAALNEALRSVRPRYRERR